MTIWQDIDKNEFYTQIQALHNQNRLPGANETSITRPESGHEGELSFEVEESLAHDFAFVALTQEHAKSVTAATVQFLCDPNRMSITLAMNDGVPKGVREDLTEIMTLLERCACESIRRKECVSSLLDIVVKLNKSIMYKMLRSRKRDGYFSWRDRGRARGAPTLDNLIAMLDVQERICRRPEGAEQINVLSKRLESMKTTFATMEALPKGNDASALRDLVEEASKLMPEDTSLVRYLGTIGVSKEVSERKDFEQITKLANYLRICRNLTKLSRSHSKWFQNIEFTPLTGFGGSEHSTILNLPLHVHAEIQLIAHFELIGESVRPRVIGCSKSACYLCNCFIRAHGLYFVPRTHGDIFIQWTVPDLPEYSPESKDRLRNGIKGVYGDVTKAIRAANTRRPSTTQPGHHVLNPKAQIMCSPPSSSANSFSITSSSAASNLTVKASSYVDKLTVPSQRSSQAAHSVVTSSVHNSDSSTCDVGDKPPLDPKPAGWFRLGRLEIFVVVEDENPEDCKIGVTPISGKEKSLENLTANIDDIPMGDSSKVVPCSEQGLVQFVLKDQDQNCGNVARATWAAVAAPSQVYWVRAMKSHETGDDKLYPR